MITSPGMTETNILGSDTKLVEWLFTVTDANDVRYYWSFADIAITSETGDLIIEESGTVNETGTQNDTGGNNQSATLAYAYKILSCSPITLNRPTAENGVLAPSDVTFTITNKDNTLTWSDFIDGTVWIHISIGDFSHSFRPRINRFRIRDCTPGYQSLTFVCEDFIQQYLRGSYPNTRLIKDIFPSIDSDINDDVCVPEPYGVAYVPLRSIYKAGAITKTATTISFVASASGAYAQVNDSGSGLGAFEQDRFVTITGAANAANNGTFYIFTSAAGRLELHTSSAIVAEGAGASVTLTQGSRYYVLGDATNTYVIDKVHSPRESGKKSEWQDLDWTLSASGTSEYYAVSKHGTNPYLNEPKDAYGIARLTLNNIVATVGTLGGLAAGEWAYGDNEPGAGLGYDTVYVRTSGSADPDGLSANYVSVDTPFTQYTKADADAVDWRVFQPMIADANRDGIADTSGLWRSGDHFLDMPVKFSRSDTLTKTNPADVIKQVLLNLGVPLIDIDVATFTTAAAVFNAYTVPLEFNGAFWKKQERTKALSTLLNMCNSILISGEKIKLHVLSKTSKKEFFKSHNLTGSTYNWLASGSGTNEYYCVLAAGSADPSLPEPSACHIAGKSATRGVPGELSAGYWGYADNDTLGFSTIYVRLSDGSDPDTKLDDYIRLPADILKDRDQGPGTFKYSGIVSKYIDDAGYFAWQNVDEPQDNLNKKIMAIGASATAISGSILELPFLNDSRDAQQAAKLSITRRLGKTANVSFDAKMSCILLQPGDVVSINHNDYGGSYDVLIDSVSIEKTAKTAKMRFVCSKFSQAFADWDDSVPTEITVGSDDSINVWQPAESGPTTNQELARSSFQVWGSPYLYVGPTENQGQYTNIQEAVNALQESRHNGIYLLNGTYPRVSVALPDRDIEIVGESQGGVILQNVAGSGCFIWDTTTKKYTFKNFSISSQNVASYSTMISMLTTSSGELNFEDLTIDLVDAGTWNGNGDIGIGKTVGSGKVSITNVDVNDGKSGMYIDRHHADLLISACTLIGQKSYGIYAKVAYAYTASVTSNAVRDFWLYGIYVEDQLLEF